MKQMFKKLDVGKSTKFQISIHCYVSTAIYSEQGKTHLLTFFKSDMRCKRKLMTCLESRRNSESDSCVFMQE